MGWEMWLKVNKTSSKPERDVIRVIRWSSIRVSLWLWSFYSIINIKNHMISLSKMYIDLKIHGYKKSINKSSTYKKKWKIIINWWEMEANDKQLYAPRVLFLLKLRWSTVWGLYTSHWCFESDSDLIIQYSMNWLSSLCIQSLTEEFIEPCSPSLPLLPCTAQIQKTLLLFFFWNLKINKAFLSCSKSLMKYLRSKFLSL